MGTITKLSEWSIHSIIYDHFRKNGSKGSIIYDLLHRDMMFYFVIDDGRK